VRQHYRLETWGAQWILSGLAMRLWTLHRNAGDCKMTFDENGEPLSATIAEWDAWIALHPQPVLTEDEYTAREHCLPLDLVPYFNELVERKMSDWPEGLYDHVRQFTSRLGACGETMICGIADWIRTYESAVRDLVQEKKRLSGE
jgi:hypothetical protein